MKTIPIWMPRARVVVLPRRVEIARRATRTPDRPAMRAGARERTQLMRMRQSFGERRLMLLDDEG